MPNVHNNLNKTVILPEVQQVSRLVYQQSYRPQYCDRFVIHSVIYNVIHNTKLRPFLIHNCLKKVINSFKTAQNYIMNDINDQGPFPLHEQSWYRTVLLIKRRKHKISSDPFCLFICDKDHHDI